MFSSAQKTARVLFAELFHVFVPVTERKLPQATQVQD
ncbi:hypothetical protein M7I_6510 [Glarea lozoyensis 74030]|uniref:Uncharacterized protein n=1 Tax=Glarea lozoyensis (strain ATCC 74030 / MF5533) TaxID=1104152 RepID=H0EUS1_GLAL7|nr:hypothetical protein M7I_6510 [Glarea lozoyensis 74030]